MTYQLSDLEVGDIVIDNIAGGEAHTITFIDPPSIGLKCDDPMDPTGEIGATRLLTSLNYGYANLIKNKAHNVSKLYQKLL